MAGLPWTALPYQDPEESLDRYRGEPSISRTKPKIPDLRVIEKQRGRLVIPGRLLPALVLVVLGGGMLATLLARSEMAIMQVKLSGVSTALNKAQSMHDRLLLEVSQLAAPQRVVNYATSKLGLVFPSSVQIVGDSNGTAITKTLALGAGQSQSLPLPAGTQTLIAPASPTVSSLQSPNQGKAQTPASTASGTAGTSPSQSPSTSSTTIPVNNLTQSVPSG